MYIKLKDFVCSFRGSISAVSADITKLGRFLYTMLYEVII